eukprot:CAMPEP_0172531480 /NCGR_PEP_ID=MMETSP1067-20121228/4873_1 /TAXON_ID=265564 ORGANISM="Thalassiosira punctigera, Strain Tpunct2005C2" /NCGR_SAMPLE_ID=MMETSP1067 /ASSEMBLY_ACC=CAM_ASM_000444 /LENGTH=109 /DNA_ID=CAMNT_0013315865 /DNA_START=129 /DNA_END=458 /DNA_ORIENTATION=+
MPPSQPKEGGIKGFLSRAGKSFYAGGLYFREKSWTVAKKAGNVAFVVATTSIVVLMPLIFEIMREGQMIEMDKLQVKDFRQQGYSDVQLQELGFPKVALGIAPAVLKQS